jgi:microcystin-dependent protein
MAFKNYDSSGNVLSRSLTDLPVGTVVSTALSAAPSGWLICDGAAVSRTNYPELFGALGTGYGAGDGTTTFNVPNSDGQMILAISTAQRIGVAMPPQFVTTLPSSPIDGTEVYYQSTTAGTGGGASNSMATVGAVWHLRYRAASASAYKWEVVGASPMQVDVDASETTTSTSYAALATAGPAITLPLAGDYLVSVAARTYGTTQNGSGYMSYDKGATGALDIDGFGWDNEITNGSSDYRYVSRKQSGLSAVTLTAKYKTSAGTSYFYRRSLTITPIRVSA